MLFSQSWKTRHASGSSFLSQTLCAVILPFFCSFFCLSHSHLRILSRINKLTIILCFYNALSLYYQQTKSHLSESHKCVLQYWILILVQHLRWISRTKINWNGGWRSMLILNYLARQRVISQPDTLEWKTRMKKSFGIGEHKRLSLLRNNQYFSLKNPFTFNFVPN